MAPFSNRAPFSKILWAVDPYDEPSRLQAPISLLKYLAGALHSVVQPVYVVSMDGISTGEQGLGGRNLSDLSSDRKVTDQIFKNIYVTSLRRPQVIQAASSQPNRIIDTLLSYGESIGADLILAGTHSRSMLSRIFQGSFSNRLLLRSPIPVLELGPKVDTIIPFDRILYAAHLDPDSRFGFRYAVKIAEMFRSELTVLHLLSRRQRDQDGGNSTAVGQSLSQRSHLMRRARVWSNWASRRGIKTEVIFQDTTVQTVEQILRVASRHRVGLILLESRSGPSVSLLKGSKVREMIRNSPCPILVQRVLDARVLRGSIPGGERSAA